jgi:hypothetical protein
VPPADLRRDFMMLARKFIDVAPAGRRVLVGRHDQAA